MSLKRQTLWSILPLLVVTGVGLISVRLFLKYLSPEHYALWFYVQTLSGAFGFVDLGFGMAVGRYVGLALGRGDKEAVREYWAAGNALAVPLLAVMALAFIGVGVVLGPRWFPVSAQDATMLRWSFVAGGVGLFMSYYGQFWNMLSQAHLDFKFVSLLKIGSSLAQILPGIAIAILTHNPLLIIAWGALASTFQVLGFVWHARSKYDLGFHLREARWSRLREMWAYSAKTTACLVVNSLFGAVDRIVAGRLAGAVEFRDYNVATNAGARLQGLSTAAMGPVFYNASRAVGAEDGQKAAAMFDEAFGLVADWYFLAATWLIVWHLPVLHLWLGAEHVPGIAPMFPALIAAFALSSISNVSRAMLGPLNRVGMEVILSVILALVTVGCVWVGWNAAGIVGVAWGFLASRFTLVSLDFYVARFIGAQGWLSARLWLRIGIQIVLALVLSLITTWIDCSFALKLSLAGMHLTIVAGWLLGPSLSSQWKQRRGLPPSSINET